MSLIEVSFVLVIMGLLISTTIHLGNKAIKSFTNKKSSYEIADVYNGLYIFIAATESLPGLTVKDPFPQSLYFSSCDPKFSKEEGMSFAYIAKRIAGYAHQVRKEPEGPNMGSYSYVVTDLAWCQLHIYMQAIKNNVHSINAMSLNSTDVMTRPIIRDHNSTISDKPTDNIYGFQYAMDSSNFIPAFICTGVKISTVDIGNRIVEILPNYFTTPAHSMFGLTLTGSSQSDMQSLCVRSSATFDQDKCFKILGLSMNIATGEFAALSNSPNIKNAIVNMELIDSKCTNCSVSFPKLTVSENRSVCLRLSNLNLSEKSYTLQFIKPINNSQRLNKAKYEEYVNDITQYNTSLSIETYPGTANKL